MTVTSDALDMLAGDPPRYPHVPGDFHRHPETGAPYVAHPTETTKAGVPRRVMYGRPSSFGSALDNPFNLVKWKERQLLIGVAAIEDDLMRRSEPDTYDGLQIQVDNRDALDGLAARCHEAAGSSLAADRGTHIHLLCERYDKHGTLEDELLEEGEALDIPRMLQAQIIDQWHLFRARLGLTALAVEQTVVNDRWRLAGTLDRLDVADHDILTAYGVLDAGVPFVGDIKTGGLTLGNDGQPNYWVKYPVQLAAYVDAVPYDTETDERGWWPQRNAMGAMTHGPKNGPNPHIALIYHYDLARALDGEPVDWQAIPVNVDAGREGGDLCRAAADFAKRRDLFAMPAPRQPTIEELAREQGVEPIKSLADLPTINTTPEETEAFLAAIAVPVPLVAVEQPAADPEPPTASSVVPRSAADEYAEMVREWSDTSDRNKLRDRIGDLIATHPEGERWLRQAWPEGVPTLKHDGHTDDQLHLILAAVRRVESEVGAPFHPDDSPPPQSRAAAQRALAAWGDDINGAWFAASLIATFEQCRLPDCTLAGLVGQFTIEQCERLWGAAQG
jgi:hypothetical protein